MKYVPPKRANTRQSVQPPQLTPKKPRCPRCNALHRIYIVNPSSNKRQQYRCRSCNHQYSDTSGTVWKHSKLSIEQRRLMLDILAEDPTISTNKFSKLSGVSYITAVKFRSKIEIVDN